MKEKILMMVVASVVAAQCTMALSGCEKEPEACAECVGLRFVLVASQQSVEEAQVATDMASMEIDRLQDELLKANAENVACWSTIEGLTDSLNKANLQIEGLLFPEPNEPPLYGTGDTINAIVTTTESEATLLWVNETKDRRGYYKICRGERPTNALEIPPVYGNGDPPAEYQEYFGNDNGARLDFMQNKVIGELAARIERLEGRPIDIKRKIGMTDEEIAYGWDKCWTDTAGARHCEAAYLDHTDPNGVEVVE